MSLFAFSRYLFLLAVLAFASGCEEKKKEAARPALPWEWEPKDPELVVGKSVYSETCSLCHNEGEEGAPMLHHKSEWDERIKKGEAMLINHAINGFQGNYGKMPAKGDNESLTEEQVTAAVKFIIATPR